MQLRLPWLVDAPRERPLDRQVVAAGRVFPIQIARHRWARRYLVRLREDGSVTLTVPRGASIAGGLSFVHAETAWIAREWSRLEAKVSWGLQTVVWWRGERVPVSEVCSALGIAVDLPDSGTTLRSAVERGWRALAAAQLPERCRVLGGEHALTPRRVSVRNQRSRWGACSSKRAITLNWRLVQMPPFVSDYVMLHELAHLEQPNHSHRFWRKVAAVCPDWREAERWLRRHGRELL